MKRRWWLLLALGVFLLSRRLVRHTAVPHGADLPSAATYDAVAGLLLSGFYRRVASEVAAAGANGRLLEIGGGPGRLAVALGNMAPGLTVVSVDISPEDGRARHPTGKSRRDSAIGSSSRLGMLLPWLSPMLISMRW